MTEAERELLLVLADVAFDASLSSEAQQRIMRAKRRVEEERRRGPAPAD